MLVLVPQPVIRKRTRAHTMDFIFRHPFDRLQWLKFLTIFCFIVRISAIERRCGKPGKPSIGQYEPKNENYSVGSKIMYRCDYPYLISKPDQRICQPDGTWSGFIPLCNDPVNIHQVLRSSAVKEKTAAKAIDRDPKTCFSTDWQKDGYLTAVLPIPSSITAVSIDFPIGKSEKVEVKVKKENSEALCSFYGNYNDKSTSKIFYCPENTGSRYVHIADLSLIQHFFEICEVTVFVTPGNPCMMPDVPYNGFGNVATSGFEREYTYFCDAGYELYGESKSYCKPSQTWTPKAPVCYKIQCVIPRSPDHGTVDNEGDIVPYDGRANYSCDPGYVLIGMATLYCKGWNKWSGNEPVCIARQCNPEMVANGVLLANSTKVGSVASLICNDGYQPLSDTRTECLSSGQWSHASLICAPILCDPKPAIPHGSFRLLANSTFYGSRLQVICDRGYVVRNDGVRMCEVDGKWEDLSDICKEITCNSMPYEVPEKGNWLLLNDSFRSTERHIRVLKCFPGYHIEGTPPIVRCLENGTWSFTAATCMKTPEAAMSTGEWTPNMMIVAAVAVGVGTAVCILCLVAIFLGIRKRRHLRTNTTVFHVGMANPPTFCHSRKGIPLTPEEHYYTSAMYDDLGENPRYKFPKPHKPNAGLPLLPLDTDPVYAQPFETGSSSSVAEYKLRKGGLGNREDPYAGHIYAEPVDSRRPPSGSSTVSGCVAETWFRNGTTVKLTRKMSLPDCQQIPHTNSNSSVKKLKEDSVRKSSIPEGLERQLSREITGSISGSQNMSSFLNGSFGLLAELQSNSIYLDSGDSHVQSSGYSMTDNDIYLGECFSTV